MAWNRRSAYLVSLFPMPIKRSESGGFTGQSPILRTPSDRIFARKPPRKFSFMKSFTPGATARLIHSQGVHSWLPSNVTPWISNRRFIQSARSIPETNMFRRKTDAGSFGILNRFRMSRKTFSSKNVICPLWPPRSLKYRSPTIPLPATHSALSTSSIPLARRPSPFFPQ